jgi:hypothetical protein
LIRCRPVFEDAAEAAERRPFSCVGYFQFWKFFVVVPAVFNSEAGQAGTHFERLCPMKNGSRLSPGRQELSFSRGIPTRTTGLSRALTG